MCWERLPPSHHIAIDMITNVFIWYLCRELVCESGVPTIVIHKTAWVELLEMLRPT